MDDNRTKEELLQEIETLKQQLADKKELEKELEKTKILMEAAFHQSPVPMVVITYPDFKFRVINKATEDFLLCKATDYLGKTPLEMKWDWKEYLPDGKPIESQTELPLAQTLQGNTTKDKEMIIIRNDGSQVWERVSASPIYGKEGELLAGILVMVDITEQKKVEKILTDNETRLKEQNEEYETLNEELKEANELLKVAKDKAEESDRLKSAFLQNMSHEVRTPMNAIIGFSTFLNDPDLEPAQRQNYTTIIINSANQLLSIVSDILTISALETKQEKIIIKKTNINTVLINLLSIFKVQAISRNISIYSHQQLTDSQATIFTDETKITQILTNLLSNAIKFTHKGSVEFGYKLKDNELEFYVKDTGIGIYKEQQEHIFQRFRQADQSIQFNYGGTGVGLSISKGFVELLDGKIWVESEINKGSTFYFTIPYKPVDEQQKAIDIQQENQKRKTVLVAEDEMYNFLFIEKILNKMNVNILHAKNGYEAVEITKVYPEIDLILMDIKMPIMDGHSAAQLIKNTNPNMRIIAQSAYALEHEREKYGGVFDDYLTKPIKVEEIRQKLKEFLG